MKIVNQKLWSVIHISSVIHTILQINLIFDFYYVHLGTVASNGLSEISFPISIEGRFFIPDNTLRYAQ